jgi:hypothetical protein
MRHEILPAPASSQVDLNDAKNAKNLIERFELVASTTADHIENIEKELEEAKTTLETSRSALDAAKRYATLERRETSCPDLLDWLSTRFLERLVLFSRDGFRRGAAVGFERVEPSVRNR